jgi:hypothetical protein
LSCQNQFFIFQVFWVKLPLKFPQFNKSNILSACISLSQESIPYSLQQWSMMRMTSFGLVLGQLQLPSLFFVVDHHITFVSLGMHDNFYPWMLCKRCMLKCVDFIGLFRVMQLSYTREYSLSSSVWNLEFYSPI